MFCFCTCMNIMWVFLERTERTPATMEMRGWKAYEMLVTYLLCGHCVARESVTFESLNNCGLSNAILLCLNILCIRTLS